jgi:hypothetical protein
VNDPGWGLISLLPSAGTIIDVLGYFQPGGS